MSNTELLTQLSNMTVSELNALRKDLEESWGVTAAVAAAPAAGGGAAAASGQDAAEKTEFDVVITEFDSAKKLKIIKALREIIPDIGLVDAKAMLESLPANVKTGAPKSDAEAAKDKLTEVGATVTLK